MKKINFISVVIVLTIMYGLFLFWADRDQTVGEQPQIKVPTSVLEVSVKDKEKVLLADVSAKDKEDGNLTSEVFIENISEFDDQKRRTVTYAVFDSDDHLTRATRQIQYSDYQPPKIELKKALCFFYLTSMEEYKDFVKATSVVDGNISSQVSIQKVTTDGDKHKVTYTVSDSCGTKTTLQLTADELRKDPNIDINLSEYMITVKKGTTIYPRSYIKSVRTMGMKNNSLKSLVEIQNNYDPYTEGTYEYIYRINRANGDYGITKLVVVVE